MFYGKGADDFINWKILGDAEHHIDIDLVPPSDTNVMKDFDFEWPWIDNFCDHLFPFFKGHAHIIDKYLSDSRASYHESMKADKIQFHGPADKDPDWKVKNFCLLLIAAATEVENGIENLWK
jgi:hypothetical protein